SASMPLAPSIDFVIVAVGIAIIMAAKARIAAECVIAGPEAYRLRNISALNSTFKPVAHAAHVAEVAGISRVGFDFAAQVSDVVIDDAIAGEGVGAPDAAEEAVAAEDAAGGIDEERKQLKLDGREIDGLTGAAKLGAAKIDFDIAEAVGR